MKLISSHATVTFLSQAAPRPWVQRLLRWLAFDEGLSAYSRKGRVQAYGSVADYTAPLIEKAGQLSGPDMDAVIREEFSEEVAAKLIGREDIATDPRFATAEARVQNEKALDAIIGEWTSRYEKREAMEKLIAVSVPAGAVFDTLELQNEPSFVERVDRCIALRDGRVVHDGTATAGDVLHLVGA